MNVNVFSPSETKAIAASTTSAGATFTAGTNVGCIRVYNAASSVAFVRWGAGSQTAVTTDMPVAPGAVEIFGKGYADSVAVILASGSGTVYVTAGEGL